MSRVCTLVCAILLISCASAVLLVKHQQFQAGRRQLEAFYQELLKQERTKLDGLAAQREVLQGQLTHATAVADATARAGAACRQRVEDLATQLTARDTHVAELRQQLHDASAAKSVADSRLGDMRVRLGDVQVEAEGLRARLGRIEEEGRRQGLSKHAPLDAAAEEAAGGGHQALAATLQQVADERGEVLLVVCDRHATLPDDLLTPFVEGALRAGVANLVALTADMVALTKVKHLDVPVVTIDLPVPAGQGARSEQLARAARKYSALRAVVALGYHALYADLDVVLTGDPFPLLTRTADVEVMSDAWDADLTHGRAEQAPDSGGAHGLHIGGVSPGLMYVRSCAASLELLDAVATALSGSAAREEAVLDALLLAPRQDDASAGVRVRVLPPDKFMTSATLFGQPHGARAAYLSTAQPVAIHVGNKEDKVQRIRAISAHYEGRSDALEQMPRHTGDAAAAAVSKAVGGGDAGQGHGAGAPGGGQLDRLKRSLGLRR